MTRSTASTTPPTVDASPRASPRGADASSPTAGTPSPRADASSSRADASSSRADTTPPRATTTTPRLFVSGPLHHRAEIPLSLEQTHYLGSVLRRASGDPVRVFNGADGEWLARLMLRGKRDNALFAEVQSRPQKPEDGPWLVFALLKRDATDLVVRQAVELGASRILPVLTERTNAARVNEDRLRAIAIEAAEQSERLTVPPVNPPRRLDAILAAWPAERRLFAAFERLETGTVPETRERPGTGTPPPPPGPGPSALLVGPEGGFTATERESLRRLSFVVPLSLGPFVLRAETAAAAGQALLLAGGRHDYLP